MTRHLVRVAIAMLLSAGSAAAQIAPPAGRLAAQYVDPETGWSLEDAIARAIAQEPSLRAARSAIEVARAMRLQAGLRPNPTIALERREEPAGTDNQTMAGVEWPLDLFRRSARIAVAERDIDAVQLEIADRERRLAADVRAAYGTLLVLLRDLTILDVTRDAVKQQHDVLRGRVEQGATPPLERDLLAVELQRLESDYLLQAGRVDAALFDLKRAVGVPAQTTVKLRDTLDALLQRQAPAVEADTGEAVTRRPDVRASEARVRILDAQIERAQREGRFDISVTANYMRMDAGFPQRGLADDGRFERVRGRFHYLSGGVMVMVPLFNRNQGAVAAARAAHAGALARVDAARVAASNEIAAARARDAQAARAAQVRRDALAWARQNLAVVQETFSVGRLTVFDVLAEQRRYLELERAYTEALREAFDARTALRRALGDVP